MNIPKLQISRKALIGIFAIAVAVTVWILLLTDTPRLAIFWLFGLAFGVVVQRSRFCFVSAISNFVLFRDGRLIKGILGGLFISTIGFAVIMFREIPQPAFGVPSTAYIAPFGWHLVLAGIMFGFGMVLASGCIMGTLYRIGEGAVISLIALLGLVIGMSVLQHNLPWWNAYISQRSVVWLPQHIGWIGALVLTFGIVAILYWLVMRYEIHGAKGKCKLTFPLSSASFSALFKTVFIKGWALVLGGILLGGFNIWLFASVQRPYGLTGEIMRWTQITLDAIRLPAAPLGTVPGS